MSSMHHPSHSPADAASRPETRRPSAVERIATAQLAAMDGTWARAVGDNTRQRLVWLGLLAMPLLLPVALPGMATAVGVLCLWVAFGVVSGRLIRLPHWLAQRELGARTQAVLARMVGRTMRIVARMARPRLLPLSARPARVFNGLMLSVAGVSMAIPVPVISFDNVLPALAVVLIAWGLRLRDGWLLLLGHVATLAAVASVVLLWWGGAMAVRELTLMLGR